MVYWGTFGEYPGSPAKSGASPVPMNHFVERLPWRVAALAGLLVGAISLVGGVDAWSSLLRVGAAFLLFGLFGLGLRAVLQQGLGERPGADGRGRHFDQTTPEPPPEEPATPSPNITDVK